MLQLSPSMMLVALLAGHALADYPLQGEFLAEGKNRHTVIGSRQWPHLLTAHSMIHAGFVGILTGSTWLALAEFCIHWMTDFAKCDKRISFNVDQAIHYCCKVAWWTIAIGAI